MIGSIYWLRYLVKSGENGELQRVLVTKDKPNGSYQEHELSRAEAGMICAWFDSPEGRSGKGLLHFSNGFCMLLRA